MRKCPKCGKTYDDSWEVCLDCREKLSAIPKISATDNKEGESPSSQERIEGDATKLDGERNMLKQSIPCSVFYPAALVIAASGLSIIVSLMGWGNPGIDIFVGVICLISGIGMLKGQNWGKWTFVIVGLLPIAITLYVLGNISSGNAEYKSIFDMLVWKGFIYTYVVYSTSKKDARNFLKKTK